MCTARGRWVRWASLFFERIVAFSLRTRTVVTPRPQNLGVGGKPAISGVSNSVGVTATANSGQWTGRRNTFFYQWYRSAASIVNATNASFSFQSAGTHSVVVTVTNPHGSKSVASAPITIL